MGICLSGFLSRCAWNRNTDDTPEESVVLQEQLPDESSSFTISEIPDSVAARMRGKSFPETSTVPMSDLRYLKVLYYNFDDEVKEGEIVCNAKIAEDFIDIFRELYRAKYQIERIQLVDDFDASDNRSMAANNTSAFNYRVVAGSTKLSYHAYGLAIDINPVQNPFVTSKVVSPKEGAAYVDRTSGLPHIIDHDDLCFKLFAAHGFTWGGDWKTMKDYQHFEKRLN